MAKGTRFVNPTDKARKEARKKELKKNKKQRQLVRSNVIEKKDPSQIITDLEKLDQLEYDALSGSAISDSLYKDKRKKLKETWERVLKHYCKEDPDKHKELKKLESDYEISHNKKLRQYEAIKAAQEVKLEDIPLPPEPDDEHESDGEDDGAPLPNCITYPAGEEKMPLGLPPGCPPGVPPNLMELVAKLKLAKQAPKIVPLSRQIPPHMATRIPILPVPPIVPQRRPAPFSSSLSHTPTSSSCINRDRNLPDRAALPSLPRINHHNPLVVNHKPPQLSGHSQETVTPDQEPQKAAVIESKPVIFRPKVTKFVPSAVRKKQASAAPPELRDLD